MYDYWMVCGLFFCCVDVCDGFGVCCIVVEFVDGFGWKCDELVCVE